MNPDIGLFVLVLLVFAWAFVALIQAPEPDHYDREDEL